MTDDGRAFASARSRAARAMAPTPRRRANVVLDRRRYAADFVAGSARHIRIASDVPSASSTAPSLHGARHPAHELLGRAGLAAEVWGAAISRNTTGQRGAAVEAVGLLGLAASSPADGMFAAWAGRSAVGVGGLTAGWG
jgi:hypothetical protein